MALQGVAVEGVHKKNLWKQMKTGILTFHRAHNYGAVLQCYALQEILKRRGHEVHVIDYRQPWIEEFYKFLSWRILRMKASSVSGLVEYVKSDLKKFIVSPHRKSFFEDFRSTYLNVTSPCGKIDLPQDFDYYVIGSDQLWSLHCLGGETDDVYMGDFPHMEGSRVIGYAISADLKSVEEISDRLPEWRKNFDALSMREKEIADKVAVLSGSPCDVCLDPTLLTDPEIWDPVIDDRWASRKYVLVYEVRWKKDTRGLLKKKAEELAAQIGEDCEVIVLSGMRYPVKDFVSLFKYARHVVTTSFHGIVFSILFETPFHAFPLWGGYDLRYKELLYSLGAEDRLVDFDDVLKPGQMDFTEIHRRLGERQKASLEFISKNIG